MRLDWIQLFADSLRFIRTLCFNRPVQPRSSRQTNPEFKIIVVLIIGGQRDGSCRVGRSILLFGVEASSYCPVWVINGSLQAKARKFGQPHSCLKCFTGLVFSGPLCIQLCVIMVPTEVCFVLELSFSVTRLFK